MVGVNRYTESEPSPLTAAGAEAVEQVDPAVEAAAVDGRTPVAGRPGRGGAVDAALARLRADGRDHDEPDGRRRSPAWPPA